MQNRIIEEITIDPFLLNAIKCYKDCNQIVFGVNSKKDKVPQLVKKLILILISARIFGHSVTLLPQKNNEVFDQISIKAELSTLLYTSTEKLYQFALFYNYYWMRINQQNAL